MARMEKQPQIVMVRDFFEANNTAYIVMEYVEGTNFIDLAKQRGGRIPADELFRLIEPLFTALSAMHKAGLIHRDISPDNLMLEHGSVRLLDFGCARESSSGTETMTVALKQGYAPIEQYQRKGQGPWTDVYALSATIYFCLTGRVPPQSLDRLLSDELVTPRKLGVDIHPVQQRALLKGMAVNPEKRFQSVDELYAWLYCATDMGSFGLTNLLMMTSPSSAGTNPTRAAGTSSRPPRTRSRLTAAMKMPMNRPRRTQPEKRRARPETPDAARLDNGRGRRAAARDCGHNRRFRRQAGRPDPGGRHRHRHGGAVGRGSGPRTR